MLLTQHTKLQIEHSVIKSALAIRKSTYAYKYEFLLLELAK